MLRQQLHLPSRTYHGYPWLLDPASMGSLRVSSQSDPRLGGALLTSGPRRRYAQSDGAIPFAQASYTLRVYDERGIGAIATAGYFNGANSIVNFALYSPAAYTPSTLR